MEAVKRDWTGQLEEVCGRVKIDIQWKNVDGIRAWLRVGNSSTPCENSN